MYLRTVCKIKSTTFFTLCNVTPLESPHVRILKILFYLFSLTVPPLEIYQYILQLLQLLQNSSKLVIDNFLFLSKRNFNYTFCLKLYEEKLFAQSSCKECTHSKTYICMHKRYIVQRNFKCNKTKEDQPFRGS